MRSLHTLLLTSLTLGVLASGCPLGPGRFHEAVADHRGAALDHASSRRETIRWEPTHVAAGSEIGSATLQRSTSPVVQASGTTNDPWARGSSGGVTQSATTSAGVNGRTSWVQ